MSRHLNTSRGAGSFFTGRARTAAAVAAFSGLALATTVSVQAAPAQDAGTDAPLSAVAAATPSAAPAVSLEPVAHVHKAEKAEKKAAQKSEKQAAKAQKAEQKAPSAVAAPAAQAPVAVAAPVAAAQAVAAPQAQPVAQPAPKAEPVAQPAPKAQPVAQPAPKAEPVAQPAPKAQPVAQPAPKAQPVAQPAPKAQPAPVAERALAPQSTPSGRGATIASAALGQLGVGQDCTALVTNALRAAGINHHGWPASYLKLGTQVSAAQARPGDLVYYANGGMGAAHIAVYIGGGKAVHGGWNGGTTAVSSVYVGSGPVFVRVG
ncbi:NlpC/P60 family protein [Kocuria sp.]|uniref:NlpC/P60 family protein n=1 Tax=Kocuria sp. TaxID=1871328 RepID=UPI002811211C|nr:NlpC/P60 family protein [Kocuria sp.]